MICGPCAEAADAERQYQQATGKPSRPGGSTFKHPQCAGCPCQHRAITPAPTTAPTS